MAVRRRDLFRWGGIGGAAGLLGGLMMPGKKLLGAKQADNNTAPGSEIDCGTDAPAAGTGVGYTAKYAPPNYLAAGSRDALHTPPAWAPRGDTVREVDLSVVETTLEVSAAHNMRVWAYGGSVPGPIVRATVGQRLRVRCGNHSGTPHSVHFHGAHDVQQDGLSRVAGSAETTYEFEAGPVGFHPYHCHVPPYAWHLGKGMYGAMIVDPVAPRPRAHEFVLCLCGFDVDADGRNEVYAWNGVAGYYERFPLKVPVGELVRIYVMNMVEHDPVASFHLHAQTFDLYRSGTSLTPHEHTDIVSLGPAERAMIEFTLPRRGRYMFHPHQSRMAERGAMGWIVAV
jgi:nitrite reductase (NO-forming)